MVNDIIPQGAEHPNVLHALTRKRAEIAGQVEHNQRELRCLISELDHIDASIRIFDPSVDIGRIKSKPVPPRHAAFKGEVARLVFRMLHDAEGPITSRDIALRLLADRGLNPDDPQLNLTMVKRVCACLRAQRQRGIVKSIPLAGLYQGWELVQ